MKDNDKIEGFWFLEIASEMKRKYPSGLGMDRGGCFYEIVSYKRDSQTGLVKQITGYPLCVTCGGRAKRFLFIGELKCYFCSLKCTIEFFREGTWFYKVDKQKIRAEP